MSRYATNNLLLVVLAVFVSLGLSTSTISDEAVQKGFSTTGINRTGERGYYS
ncbi:hypothetical protein [Enterobacter sp. R4-368]|uniref:hypothetical protein n=1 Tax=Enterobacter sp. R4-368 TaxID=1166130 RepID=UPI00034EF34E|nr:hypothetical protein [Enterobacter sp. R4-368]AGN88336.1 hypothetical protein H650_00515 [Enterobacter sp. R4-368]